MAQTQTRWFGAATALAVLALASPASADCAKDADCKGDRVCDHAQCVSPPRGASPPVVSSGPTVRTATGEVVTLSLASPPRFAFSLGSELLLSYTPSALGYATALGGGLEIAPMGVLGATTFPDTHGGSWHGILFQAFAQGIGLYVWGKDGGNPGQSAGAFMFNGGGGLGYTYMSFGKIGLDYSQHGLGFAASWRVAGQWDYLSGNTSLWSGGTAVAGTGSSSTTMSGVATGPWVALLIPRYAAQKGSLSYGYISASMLAAGPMGTQLQLGGGGEF